MLCFKTLFTFFKKHLIACKIEDMYNIYYLKCKKYTKNEKYYSENCFWKEYLKKYRFSNKECKRLFSSVSN